mmetsp:Transcript_52560/g.120757  ORF Transcript_52560/g.120757 Transcript_52560/m.120757 type:complete len:244 (-) Transcript_52560:204-935(-)
MQVLCTRKRPPHPCLRILEMLPRNSLPACRQPRCTIANALPTTRLVISHPGLPQVQSQTRSILNDLHPNERSSSMRVRLVNKHLRAQSTAFLLLLLVGERVWKLWQVHARILSPAKASEQQPPGNVVEELAHTCICLGARLEDESADRLRVVLRRLVRHGTLVGHVSLVAGNRKHERLLDVALKLPDPLLELVERVLISDGKDQDGRDGTAIVQRSHRSEALLAGGVPNLQRHLLPIDGQLLD